MAQQTALYQEHVSMGAKMVDFGGWDMPINYGSQIEEHHTVRSDAGMFDVSHMTIVDIHGEKTKAFLQYLLANDVDKLKESGKALYTCMLKEDGCVIDDLIVYYLTDSDYRLVVNSSTREKDLAWINLQAGDYALEITERDDLSMVAVQGPKACEITKKVLGNQWQLDDLNRFYAEIQGDWMVARTGYTGEDGYEILLPTTNVVKFWLDLNAAGVKPIGLGARDTLRLEAGMNLYGSDMDESITPLESGLTWTLAMKPEDRAFIGRDALEKQANTEHAKFVGLILDSKGVLRNHQKVITEAGEGEITSGSFSPTLGKAIAFARVPHGVSGGCKVEMRGKQLDARIVSRCFVREGKVLVE